MGTGLGLGNEPVGRSGLLLHCLGQIKAVDEPLHVPDPTVLVVVVMAVLMVMLMVVPVVVMIMVMMVMVLVVMVVVVMVALLLTVDHHTHMGTGDALAGDTLRAHLHTGNEAVHLCQKRLFLLQQLIERRHQHIACRAHGALQVQCSHLSSIPFI